MYDMLLYNIYAMYNMYDALICVIYKIYTICQRHPNDSEPKPW